MQKRNRKRNRGGRRASGFTSAARIEPLEGRLCLAESTAYSVISAGAGTLIRAADGIALRYADGGSITFRAAALAGTIWTSVDSVNGVYQIRGLMSSSGFTVHLVSAAPQDGYAIWTGDGGGNEMPTEQRQQEALSKKKSQQKDRRQQPEPESTPQSRGGGNSYIRDRQQSSLARAANADWLEERQRSVAADIEAAVSGGGGGNAKRGTFAAVLGSSSSSFVGDSSALATTPAKRSTARHIIELTTVGAMQELARSALAAGRTTVFSDLGVAGTDGAELTALPAVATGHATANTARQAQLPSVSDVATIAASVVADIAPRKVFGHTHLKLPQVFLADSLAAFADESAGVTAAMSAAVVEKAAKRAPWALTVGVLAADLIALAYIHRGRIKTHRGRDNKLLDSWIEPTPAV